MAHDIGDQTLAADRIQLDTREFHKAHASLVVLQGAEIGREFRLKRGGMIVGRGLEADVRIADDLVSREHARIESMWDPSTQESHYVLVDLGSTNRTFVNSRQIQRVELLDGDKIHIGNSILKFVLLDDIEAKFHAEIRSRISYDRLTGLLTRESLYLALEKELQRCGRHHLPLAVLMMDLDRFKSVNDTHGHTIGSRVLAEAGRRIGESLRARDVSARYGGDEFITYLSETPADAGGLTGQRIRHVIGSRPFEIDGRSIHLTISIGVSAFPDHGRTLETLVKRADAALYRSKEEGRDRVSVDQGSPGGSATKRGGARRKRRRRPVAHSARARRSRRPRATSR
jgi:diguanylate cyclase (GGDEF)-like protein